MIQRIGFLGLIGLSGLAACQHQTSPSPAVLADGSEATRAAFESTLLNVLDKPFMRLRAGDLTTDSEFTLMPPPLGPNETMSTAKPERYQLMMQDGVCFVVEMGTEDIIPLTNVACRKL